MVKVGKNSGPVLSRLWTKVVASRPGKSARYNFCMSCNQYTSSASLQFCMLTGQPGLRHCNCRPRTQFFHADIADVR